MVALVESQKVATELAARLAEMDDEARRLNGIHKSLTVLGRVSEMTSRNTEAETDGGAKRKSTRRLRTEQVAELTQLRNDLRHVRRSRVAAHKALGGLIEELNAKQAALRATEKKFTAVKEATQWDMRRSSRARRVGQEDDDARAARRQLEAAAGQCGLEQRCSEEQTANLVAVAKKISQYADIEEKLVRAEALKDVKKMELSAIDEEIASLNRIAKRKELMLAKIADEDDTDAKITVLENRKRAMHDALSKHETQRQISDKSIRAEALRLLHAQAKLAAYDAAIQKHFLNNGQPLDGDDVDASLVDDLCRRVMEQQGTKQDRVQELAALDADVEMAEKKCQILEHALVSIEQREQHTAQEYVLLSRKVHDVDRDHEEGVSAIIEMLAFQRQENEAKLYRLEQATGH